MASNKKGGLGRGLQALMGAQVTPHEINPDNPAGNLQMLPRSQLQAGKYQPRTQMDESSLAELAHSISTQGFMQPLVVRPIGPNQYEIIAGERRFRAAGIAGLTEVPAIIKNVGDEQALSLSLIENIQREDLNPLEEAQGIQRLIREFNYTHDSCASAIGRSRSAVSNLLRLLNLAAPVQTMLLAGDIDMGHARALLSLDSAQQIMLATEINARRLSVRETEKRVQAILQGEGDAPKEKMRVVSGDIIRLEQQLSDSLGAEVLIKMGAKNKGKMTIAFGNLDTLEGILAKIGAHEA
ncbi:MAG: ParB/RepB/Spo0J family partition protein [Formosimonas sp.]